MRFKDVIGQEAAIQKIQEAIATNRLGHALLLVGAPGVGNMALATAIAQYVNCLQPVDGDSCGKCSNCLKISKGIHPDIKYILPIFSKTEGGKRQLSDAFYGEFRNAFFENPYFSFPAWKRTLGGENKQLFISVHEIRDLKKGIYLKAFEAKYKIVIVWNSELINVEGANAFLKLLEEPPDRTMIIMTCSDPSRLLTTINSRCQQIMLSRIPTSKIRNYLIEKNLLEEEVADEVSLISEGSIANATEFLNEGNQAMSAMYIAWLRAVYKGDYQQIQDELAALMDQSREAQKLFLELAIKKMRDSLMFQIGLPSLALATSEERTFQENFSKIVTAEKVNSMIEHIENGRRAISGNAQAHMVLTALSLRMHGILRS